MSIDTFFHKKIAARLDRILNDDEQFELVRQCEAWDSAADGLRSLIESKRAEHRRLERVFTDLMRIQTALSIEGERA